MSANLTSNGKGAISDKEKHLIELLRDLKFGQVTVFVQDGQPVRVERPLQSVKL